MTYTTDKLITKEEKEFASGKIGSLFLKYAMPGAICLLFVGIQTIIDGAFVGNYAGANALAGLNIAMPVFTLITAVTVVLGIGGQTVIGISLGEGNYKKACDALYSAMSAVIVFSLSIMLIILFFSETIVKILGADQLLKGYASDYLTSLAPFFPLLAILYLGDYALKAQGKPYVAMRILAISVILNIVFDYIFIAHFQMGTSGAGLATGISFSIGAIIIIPRLLKRNANLTLLKGKMQYRLLAKMLYNGSSEGVAEISAGITMYMFNLAMMYYVGASGVAAFTSINYMMFLGITLFLGMSDGIIPVMSYNYGAGNMERVKLILKRNVFVNGTLGIILCILAFVFGREIATLFFEGEGHNEEAMNIAVNGSKICAFAFLFNGFNIAMSSFFTSMGDARSSIVIASLRGLIFIAVGIMIYPLIIGVDGVWIAIPAAEVMTLCIACFILRKKLKKL